MSSSAAPQATTLPSTSSAAPATAPAARPDFIPEKFWDPAANTARLEDLARGYQALESRLGQGKQAWETERLAKRPAAADAYEPKVEGFEPEFLKSHPLTPVLRELAYENGLDQEAFNGLASKVVGALAAAAPKPEEEIAKLGENATARLQAAEAFVTSTFTDPAERDALALVATTAAGVKVIEKLQALASGKPIGEVPKGEGPAAQARKSRAEINQMMQDERYWNPRKRDPGFIAEVQQWFETQPS